MKKLLLIPLMFLLVGCDTSINLDGNTSIIEKMQDASMQKRHVARYLIYSDQSPLNIKKYLVMSDDFGNVGDMILFTNKVMCAKRVVTTTTIKVEDE